MIGPGAIDIVCNPFTPLEVEQGQVGVDEHFYDKVRMPHDLRRGVSLPEYVDKMDRAGVALSFLIAVRGGDMRVKYSFAIPYERIVGYCEQFPDRFRGLAGVDPSRGIRGLREFDLAIRDYGFVGGHLYPHWFELPPDHAKFYPFYAKCCELDVPIMMQVGHCLDYQRDRVLKTVGRPIMLDQIAIDFPELKLIGIHLGWPWTEELIAVCYKHQNVFMSGDAYGPRHWPDNFVHFINSWGKEKVMFGTDWPVIDPERAIIEIDQLDLRPEAKQLFLRDNALRVFQLEQVHSTDATLLPKKQASHESPAHS